MCGIFLSCSEKNHCYPSGTLLEKLRRRGPDSVNTILRTARFEPTTSRDCACETQTSSCSLTFVSTVLSLRGDSLVSQPLVDLSSGSLLCWNGEAWKTSNGVVQGNDAEIVFDLFLDATQAHNDEKNNDLSESDEKLPNLIKAIGSIAGPYAFIFYDAPCQRLFYGRDALGRRSLLTKRNPVEGLILCSVADEPYAEDWTEVEAGGVYMLDLRAHLDPSSGRTDRAIHIPWLVGGPIHYSPHSLIYPFPSLNKDNSNSNSHTPLLTTSSSAVTQVSRLLQESISLRIENIPVPPSQAASPARVAVLFSGGLDCTILACLIHNVLPKEHDVDLLNVAFENPRVIQAAAAAASTQKISTASSPYSLCPDRITGLASHVELLRICPNRKWRFVSINVTYGELQAHRYQIISLIRPNNTEMDFSIACALYFAARGSGTIPDVDSGSLLPYGTPARVLFSGLGADELFGGYTRHATAFERRGFRGLADELELDFKRLGTRNLGRDDRVISHWGKEVRYPYLDKDLVSWVLSLPVWEKCGFGQINGYEGSKEPALQPGKKLLRLLAWTLGLRGAAAEKKRAIQFGARTAKMEARKTKGTQLLSQTDAKARLGEIIA